MKGGKFFTSALPEYILSLCLVPPLCYPSSTLLTVHKLIDYQPVLIFPYRICITVPAFFSSWTLDPWKWDRYVVPKRR
jgi:hypothetical protein